MTRTDPVTDDSGTPDARHGKLPRRSAGRSALAIAASVLAVLLVAGGAVAVYAAVDLYRAFDRGGGAVLENEDLLDGVPDIGTLDGGLSFLLVGSDRRPEDGRFGDPEEESAVLNDVNMLLHISQDQTHVEVVSFPRDLLVEVPECPDPADPEGEPLSAMSEVKINSVLAYGGLTCVVSTIENLTGVDIPVAGVVEFDGVAALSEAVGGVEVCLAEPIDDPYSGFSRPAGTHVISGYEALAFLRTRHGQGDGSDLGRIAGQQAFMASLARTLQSSDTLTDPVKLYSIAKAVLENVDLSNALRDPVQLMSIAKTVQQIDLGAITFVQYPTEYTDDFGALVPSASADELNLALQNDQPVELDPNATSDASFGTQPDPTAAPPVDAPTDPVEPPATEAPTATDAPPATTAPGTLPPDITGNTGVERRCSTANEG